MCEEDRYILRDRQGAQMIAIAISSVASPLHGASILRSVNVPNFLFAKNID